MKNTFLAALLIGLLGLSSHAELAPAEAHGSVRSVDLLNKTAWLDVGDAQPLLLKVNDDTVLVDSANSDRPLSTLMNQQYVHVIYDPQTSIARRFEIIPATELPLTTTTPH